MFSWYKYLIVNLVFSHLGVWSGNLFLIAPFPDLCLLVLFIEFINLRSYVQPFSFDSIDRGRNVTSQSGLPTTTCHQALACDKMGC